ncbi:MAG: hypothetical protein EOO10_17870 [Chitinophagaceae bacterium]|nr:MAG: hypothetical protein EOO10_17870 [Chitinophagaceae bacterium]
MFLPFNRKAKSEQQNQHSFQDKVAAGIVQKGIKLQLRWAHFMHRKTEHLSSSAKRICLLLFCTVTLGCSLFTMVKSFQGNRQVKALVTPIHVPAHAAETGDKHTYGFQPLRKDEIQRIELFKDYINGLHKTEGGKLLRDSILLARPGLMDSIRIVEELYQLQSSQK